MHTISIGKGKGVKVSGKKDYKNLRAELERQGFTVARTKNGHYTVTKDGVWIAGMPSTPSEARGFRNTLAALRRAGFIWKH